MSISSRNAGAGRGTRRRGFALPAALFLIVVLTVIAASSISMVGGEYRVVRDQTAQLQALALARSGVERFLAERTQLGFTSMPPAPVESVRIELVGGYADVVLELVRPGSGFLIPDVYLLRSRGVRVGGPEGETIVSERSIAQYSQWQWPSMQVRAAWTSLSGITKSDSLGMISGVDACGSASTVAGVAVPTGGYSQSEGPLVPTGEISVADLGTAMLGDTTIHVDWVALVEDVPALQTDYAVPRQSWPAEGKFGDADFWPLILVTGDYTLPSSGRGTLVVTKNLTIPAGRTWDGIILVGRSLYGNDGVTVNGAVISGLSAKFTPGVPPSDAGTGNVTYRYNSCNVKNALERFRGLTPFRNASIDNWPTY